MDKLTRQVRRAQRRLTLQRFLRSLGWCWFATLLAATVLIALDKFWKVGLNGWNWLIGQWNYQAPAWVTNETFLWVWVGTALGGGLLAAMSYTWWTRRSPLDAAIEIDRRFGLKERVSSSLSLSGEELETEAGRALLADALKRVDNIHVAEQFGVRPGRWTWLPVLPAAAAFLIAVLLPEAVEQQAVATQTVSPRVARQVKSITKKLNRDLVRKKEEAREKGLEKAAELFQKLEQGTEQLTRNDENQKRDALVKLNDLAEELEKRRQEIAQNDKLREQLDQMQSALNGPADPLSKALREGDLKQAMNEIQKLKEQISQGKMDENARKQLGQQLAQMQEKLNQMVEAQKKAEQQQQELKKQIAAAKQAGDKAQAQKLQQQLDKLKQENPANPQMKQLAEMAKQMGECAKCMQNGDAEKAMEALDGMQTELEALQAQLEEMELLDEALDEIAQARQNMNRRGGEGMDGDGDGLGEGQGRGDRPEERTDVRTFDSTVKQKTDRGKAVVTQLIDGPIERGEVEQEIKEQIESARAEATDPLTDQKLPRDYREHAQRYFELFREGGAAPAAAEPQGELPQDEPAGERPQDEPAAE